MRALIIAALLFALAAPAFADDKADIQARNDAFSAAANRGDVDGLVALYAPDAAVMPPDNSVVKGPDIHALFTRMVGGVANLKLTATDVKRLSPDYIREIGVVTFDTKTDKPTAVTASYVVVWKKVDGAWKLWTDIFH